MVGQFGVILNTDRDEGRLQSKQEGQEKFRVRSQGVLPSLGALPSPGVPCCPGDELRDSRIVPGGQDT